jgi:magnesium/cobalt transport protein CorA
MKETEPNIYAYLYDADGSDEEVQLKDVELKKLTGKKLLWVNILKRDEKLIRETAAKLDLTNLPVKSILDIEERPKVDKFEKFCRIFIISVATTKKTGKFKRVPIDFIVGENFVLTIHDGGVEYFIEFRKREKGETNIGELNSKSFLISLLDMHILSYFRALETVEENVDKFDEKILKEDLKTSDFLTEMVSLRQNVSNLRRWLTPHRDVFYALARPDFFPEDPEKAANNFHLLNQHFESVVDSIEVGRDTVLSLFDLFATKAARKLDRVMHRLTFITLIVGTMGVIAGVLGMNFDLAFFKDPNGFWMAVGLMGVLAICLTLAARFMRWL